MYQTGFWHRQHHLRLRLSLRVSVKHDEVRENAGFDRRGKRKVLPPECREVHFRLVVSKYKEKILPIGADEVAVETYNAIRDAGGRIEGVLGQQAVIK